MSDEVNDQEPESKSKPSPGWLEQFGIPVRQKFWSSDKFLSLLAFLISIGTFSTFAYQTYLIRKQQYANTMPYLILSRETDGGGAYLVNRLYISNKGVGPAFIQDVKIRYQDTVYRQAISNFYFDNVNLADSIDYSIDNGYIPTGYVVSAGEQMLLIKPNSEPAASAINRLFFGRDKAVIEITYSSVYDEVWRVSNESYLPEKID